MELTIWLRAEWDRVAGWGAIALGGLVLLLGYHGVSESLSTGRQLCYIVSDGIGGLFCVAVGVTLLVSADLHDEWRKLDRIEDAIRESAGAPARDAG
jgi:hypothetical protein